MFQDKESRIIISLVLLYFVYLCIGAAVFHALEFANEEALYLETLEQLQQYNLTDVSKNITVKNLRNLIEIMSRARSNGIQFNSDLQPMPAHNWNWHNAFFFAGTVVTTIGYGNISPYTGGGRIFCIFFAAIGLPIFGVMIGKIGKSFFNLFVKLDKKIKPKEGRKKYRKTFDLLLFVSSVLVFCLLVPSIIFMSVEGWTFQDSFYYSFITLTTIGFGDFVVGTNPDNVDTFYTTIYRFAVYFWILFGLACVAAVIGFFSGIIKKEGSQAIGDQDKNKTERNESERTFPSNQRER